MNEGFLEIKDFKDLDVGKEIKNASDLEIFYLSVQPIAVKEIIHEKLNNYFSSKEKNYSLLIDKIKFLLSI